MRRVWVTVLVLALAACGRGAPERRAFEVAESIDRVELRGAAMHVEVSAGPGPVLVQETGGRKRPATSHRVTGTTLVVTDPGCPKPAGCEVTFTIRVPVATAVSIHTDVGNVRVRDLTGDLTVESAVGDIDATALGGKSVLAQTGTGSVHLRFSGVPDRVDARVSVGEVDIRLPRSAKYAVDCTGYSEVSVDRDDLSPHRITARSPLGISIRPA
jgi:hypothetical protein